MVIGANQNYFLKTALQILLFALICFPLFYKIQNNPVKLWDESRNAVNAIEMFGNHNYLVRHFNEQYDSWETKPPLLIWLQVISMKMFGTDVFAIRFPSMMASILTCVVIVLFFWRYFNDKASGFLSALILTTSRGYLGHHIARTGDHDALLVLFTTCIVLLAFIFVRNNNKLHNAIQIICLWLLVLLGFFTKSISVFFITPGIVLYLLYHKQLIKILRLKCFYAGMFLFISIVFAFYYFHEKATPGYLTDVWQNEWLPRATNTAERYQYSQSPWYYYLFNLFDSRFVPWIYLLPISMGLFFLLKPKSESFSFVLFLLTVVIGFLSVISSATTNIWYDAPAFPLFSMLTGFTLVFLYRQMDLHFFLNYKWPLKWIALIVVFIFFGFTFYKAIQSVSYTVANTDTCFGQFLKNESALSRTNSYKVFHTGFNQSVIFYVKELQLKNYNISFTNNPDSLKMSDIVLISKTDDIELVSQRFQLRKLNQVSNCSVFEIRKRFSSN